RAECDDRGDARHRAEHPLGHARQAARPTTSDTLMFGAAATPAGGVWDTTCPGLPSANLTTSPSSRTLPSFRLAPRRSRPTRPGTSTSFRLQSARLVGARPEKNSSDVDALQFPLSASR